jgi:hypothetical protein
MHDGVAPYFLLYFGILEQPVSVTTDMTRWTTAWPVPSLDLQPLYFYLWGHLQSTVYATDDRLSVEMIRTTPGIFQQHQPIAVQTCNFLR